MDEQQAIARLKQGDLAGLEFLVRQYQAKAVHTAYLIIGDPALAEDIVADGVLARCARKSTSSMTQRAFQPWFLRVVVNDAIKAAKRQKRAVSLDEPSGPAVTGCWMTPPNRKNWLKRVTCAGGLESAPAVAPEQRAVIVQRHFLEMSEAEMVEKLQRPASTVKWWLHTARERLKALLVAYQDETSGENHEKR